MNCDGNYNPKKKKRGTAGEEYQDVHSDSRKTKVFRLPRNKDDREQWIQIIPRDNIRLSNDTVVCERHWPPDYPTKNDYGKKRPIHPPSVFKCIKPSLIPTIPATPRPTASKCFARSRNTIPDELELFNKMDRINELGEIMDKINSFGIIGVSLIVNKIGVNLLLQSLDFLDGTGVARFILKKKDDLTFDTFHSGIKCTISTLNETYRR